MTKLIHYTMIVKHTPKLPVAHTLSYSSIMHCPYLNVGLCDIFFVVLVLFCKTVSLCNSDYPEMHRNPPVSDSPVYYFLST